MNCPRHKFVNLDYSQNLDEQKKNICLVCDDNLIGAIWGEHCNASLTCLMTGEKLGKEAFERIPKNKRESATHTLSDKGRQLLNKRMNDLQKKLNRPLW